MIARFCQGIGFSSTGYNEDVILEPDSETKITNMSTMDGSSTPYFYLDFSVIHELRVFIPLRLSRKNS